MHRDAPFWRFALEMFRRRRLVALGLAGAIVSALGLGAGLAAMVPVLKHLLTDEGATLPELARGGLERLPESVAAIVPERWIASLPDGRFDAVLWIMVGLIFLTVIGASASFAHMYAAETMCATAASNVRRRVFRRVVRMPMSALIAGQSADLVSRIVNDSWRLREGFKALVGKGPSQLLKGLAAFIAALLIDWRAVVVLPVAALLLVIIRKFGKRVRRASRASMKAQAALLEATHESLQGLRVVKTHGGERREIGRFGNIDREYVRQQLRARTVKALASPLIETLSIVVFAALAVLAAKPIIEGNMDGARFLTALLALGVAGASLKPLSSIVQEIQGSSPAATRLDELLRASCEEVPARRRARHPLPRLPRHSESIEFEGVRFRYPGAERDALAGVDLRIEHGQTVAIVGPNGSGKTTLLSMLPRLFDLNAGRILLDGRDIAAHELRSLRRQIGVVTQDVVLFRGTILQNIAYGVRGASREAVEQAARKAHAHEFITQKPGGYDAHIGDQGVALSGGQRQRIAIARAILRDPAILLLDEATSMIDAESEAHITEALADFAKGRTTLVIAHRLSTVLHADRIVVMDAGRVVDSGRHEDLLERCDLYRTLASRQLLAAEV